MTASALRRLLVAAAATLALGGAGPAAAEGPKPASQPGKAPASQPQGGAKPGDKGGKPGDKPAAKPSVKPDDKPAAKRSTRPDDRPKQVDGALVERIVAVVNEEIVLQSELEEKYAPAIQELMRQMEAATAAQRQVQAQLLRRRVLEALVDERLLVQQAQQLKLGVTSEEIDRAVEEIRKQNGVELDELQKALRAQGMTMAQYRQDLRRQILRLKVINAAVRSRISVSDEEVKAYYEQNVRRMGVQRSVRASHVFLLIPEGASQGEVESKRRLGAELVARARGGEDFAKLAKQYSDDPATKDEGGDLGYFTRGSLPPAVEEIVFNMEVGEVKGPIRAARGFHVMKVLDRKDEGIKPLGQIKEQLRQQLYQQEMEKATKAWLTEIRKKAHIEYRL